MFFSLRNSSKSLERRWIVTGIGWRSLWSLISRGSTTFFALFELLVCINELLALDIPDGHIPPQITLKTLSSRLAICMKKAGK
mmetsp:Transcript_33883/g.71102  ORF Transcript_33883/g.71102 Transcript_33883/m.71102 type:complete len:83 (-) Transcript_33883:185-433(-)